MIEREVVERVLSGALKTGGDWAEVFVEDKRNTGVGLDDGKVDSVSSGRDRGAGIRVVVGETTGFAHTADLTEEGLLRAAEAASAVARSGGGGVKTVALTPQTHPKITKAEILPETIEKAKKVDLLLRGDELARQQSGAIVQVMGGFGDLRRRILVANSDGLYAEDDQVRVTAQFVVVAMGDAGMQTGFDAKRVTTGFETFADDGFDAVALEAARVAISKLDARPAPSGMMPVVLKHGSGGYIFHEACGHPLEADFVRKGTTVFAGRVGEKVASEKVTFIDDSSIAGEWGSFSIDDEGHPAGPTTLIQDGVLVDFMWDGLRARQEGRASTGNGRRQSYQELPLPRMTNTFLANGTDNAEDIIASTDHGIYVCGLGGGQVDTITGDFVFGMSEAYLIENGKITDPLREANLIGNGPETLKYIDAVADDFKMAPGFCGKSGQTVNVGSGQPTMRVTNITVGGTAG